VVISFTLYGLGAYLSGSPFLALVRDSVPRRKQGLAISVVQTTLITLFPIVGIIFSFWMVEYSEEVFWQMVIATMVVGGFFWWFAVAGVEKSLKPGQGHETAAPQASVRETFGFILRDRRTRHFFNFLALATLAAWAQEAILEPFGAQVLSMDVEQTTRLSAYWQGATVLVLIPTAYFLRRRRPEEQTRLTKASLLMMACGIALLGGSSLGGQVRLLEIGLIIFGCGFGLYTFGGYSLMAAMTTDARAGSYLGLWTVCILLSRGLGIAAGGVLRDAFLSLTGSLAWAYGGVFLLEAVGLAAAALILSEAQVLSFARDAGRMESTAAAMPLAADT
jgi:BCD family chlorophyll transporter-like MFS transporter